MWPHLTYTERLKDTFTAHSTLQLHSARVHHPLLIGRVVIWLLGCSRPFHTGSRMGMMEIQPPPGPVSWSGLLPNHCTFSYPLDPLNTLSGQSPPAWVGK